MRRIHLTSDLGRDIDELCASAMLRRWPVAEGAGDHNGWSYWRPTNRDDTGGPQTCRANRYLFQRFAEQLTGAATSETAYGRRQRVGDAADGRRQRCNQPAFWNPWARPAAGESSAPTTLCSAACATRGSPPFPGDAIRTGIMVNGRISEVGESEFALCGTDARIDG